jgi:peptidoglycan/LPS O-acetylase OafA/YrhL
MPLLKEALPTEKVAEVIELQALRGLAALSVMVGHTLSYYNLNQPPQLGGIFNGHAAVVLFFVLSGYVLSLSLLSRDLSVQNIFYYYIRRMFRIYPALIAVSLLSLFYIIVLRQIWQPVNLSLGFGQFFLPSSFDGLHILASFAGVSNYLIPQAWTISIELVASVLLPILLLVARRGLSYFVIMLAVAILFSLTYGSHTFRGVGVYLVDFVIGMGLTICSPWLRRIFGNMGGVMRNLLGFACVFSLLQSSKLLAPAGLHQPFDQLVEAFSAAVLMALIIFSGLNWPVLRHRAIVYLGDVSYSLYIVHVAIIFIVALLMQVAFEVVGVKIDLSVSATILLVFTVLLSLIISSVMYRGLELPGIRGGKNLCEWLRQRSGMVPV